jgi:hypothetical protein
MKDVWPEIFGYSIFCEDIREETGNKKSYMGVFHTDMGIQVPLPTALPKFCMAIHYIERVELEPKRLELMLFLPGDDEETPSIRSIIPHEEHLTARKLAVENGNKVISMVAPVILAPFAINVFGEIRVRMKRGDDEIVRLGALRIVPQPAANTSPQAEN